jgi:polysaccharide export outer membrane protein
MKKASSIRHLTTPFLNCFKLVVGVLWLSVAVSAQTGQSGGGAVTPVPSAPTGTAGMAGTLIDPTVDYRITSGDSIEVLVDDAQELNGTWRVTPTGTFEMPFLGVVAAQGKTTIELARFITEQLKQQDYLKQPLVKVIIRQYSNQYFFIQGAVKTPGVYPMEGRPSLVKLISLAGGLADNFGPTAFILRSKKGKPAENPTAQTASLNGNAAQTVAAKTDELDDDYDFIKVNLTPIFQFGKFDQNVRLEPGDIDNIPPARMFYVGGEVRSPGSFVLKDGTTLRQAIALAQGTTFNAATNRGIIFRDDPESGKRQELAFDARLVMDGKKEDILLMPNDIVIVPNSRTKTVGNALLNAFGISAARMPTMRY